MMVAIASWAIASGAEPDGLGCDEALKLPDHAVAVGYGHGAEADARRSALDEAHTRLLGQVCAGTAEVRCLAVERQIRDWKQDYSPKAHAACAAAAVYRDAVEG